MTAPITQADLDAARAQFSAAVDTLQSLADRAASQADAAIGSTHALYEDLYDAWCRAERVQGRLAAVEVGR